MRLRRKQKIILYTTIAGITVAVLSSSIWFASYRFFNARLITERSSFEQQLVDKDNLVKKYEDKSHAGFILQTDKKPGEIITDVDIKGGYIPVYVAPQNIVSNKKDIVGKVIKINALTNTPITSDMIYANGPVDPTARKLEVDYVALPYRIAKNDIVDIEIVYPDGEKFIVVSKKKLVDVEADAQRMYFVGVDEEQVYLDSALVDAYINNAEIRAVQYSDPEMQPAAAVTYLPNVDVLKAIKDDPAILDKAKYDVIDKLRKSLDDRLKTLTSKSRVGAEDPVGSAVSKRKKIIGPGAAPTNPNAITKPGANSATVMDPGKAPAENAPNLLGGK